MGQEKSAQLQAKGQRLWVIELGLHWLALATFFNPTRESVLKLAGAVRLPLAGFVANLALNLRLIQVRESCGPRVRSFAAPTADPTRYLRAPIPPSARRRFSAGHLPR